MSTNAHLHSQLLIRCGISPSSGVNHSPMLSDVSPMNAGGGMMQPPSMMMSNVGGSNSPDQLFEDLEPVSRDRSNTWPLRRPNLDINAQTSPLIHELIPEGEEDSDGYDSGLVDLHHTGLRSASSAACGGMGSPDARSSGGYSPGVSSPIPATLPAASSNSDTSDGGPSTTSPATKKSTTRRNAWGNMSYADLITQAIMSSPEKRLTLSQVYEWMVQNVPYFRDKGDSNSSAGWKNSIRHNLSLHSRFMRIQNEGAGKSSWWVINPEAKPGRNPRRRAQTLETSSKTAAAIEKKRGRVRRKVAEMRAAQQGQTLHSASSSVVGSQASLVSHDLYPNDDDNSLGAVGLYDNFRPRAHSNLSMPGGSSARVSPSMESAQQRLGAFDAFDDFPFDTATMIPNDILDRTGDMRLDAPSALDASPLGAPPPYHQQGLNGLLSNDQMINGLGSGRNNSVMPTSQIKMEPGIRMNIKSEQMGGMQHVQPPPSYQELHNVRQGGGMQNPLLRNQQLAQQHNLQQTQPHQQLAYNQNNVMTNGGGNGDYFRLIQTSNGYVATNANGWPTPVSCGQQLPLDLANLTLPNEPGMEMDVAEVLRHEMAATGGKLDFGDSFNL